MTTGRIYDKKTSGAYVAKWYGGILGLLFVLGALGYAFGVVDPVVLTGIVFVSFLAAILVLPIVMTKKMEKAALVMEKEFPQKGFSYQYKFTAHSGIFYIDTGGRLGVVWKHNPAAFYYADLAGLTDVRVHDGKQLRGTSLVSCQFKLGGKKYKIYTLRVSNGQLSMKSPQVLEAISKADKLCEMLQTAKQAALHSRVTP